jgi:hypothetical protein
MSLRTRALLNALSSCPRVAPKLASMPNTMKSAVISSWHPPPSTVVRYSHAATSFRHMHTSRSSGVLWAQAGNNDWLARSSQHLCIGAGSRLNPDYGAQKRELHMTAGALSLGLTANLLLILYLLVARQHGDITRPEPGTGYVHHLVQPSIVVLLPVSVIASRHSCNLKAT